MNLWLDEQLFTFGKAIVTARSLGESLIVILTTVLLARWVKKWLPRVFKRHGLTNQDDIDVYTEAVRLFVWLLGCATALHIAGFRLMALFATGGLFAVGLGFAFKNLAENFIAGVSLKLEDTVRRGDIVEFDGHFVRVKAIGARATRGRTRDGTDLVIPNSTLAGATVSNLTLRGDRRHLIQIEVGVAYSSDMKQVRDVLEQTAQAVDWRSQETEPWILMAGFGDSCVQFEVHVCIDEPWHSRGYRSQLYEAVWWALKDAGIVIAFPQLDMHVATAAAPSVEQPPTVAPDPSRQHAQRKTNVPSGDDEQPVMKE
jgi:potassium efflux system protein